MTLGSEGKIRYTVVSHKEATVRQLSILLLAALVAGCSQSAPLSPSSSTAPSAGGARAYPADGEMSTTESGQVFWDDDAILKIVREKIAVLKAKKKLTSDKILRKQIASRDGAKAKLSGMAKPATTPKSPEMLYRTMLKHTLIIFTFDMSGKYHCGAAVAIGADAVVTNCHVLQTEKNETLFVAMDSAGNVYPIKEVLASSRRADLAILRLDTAGKSLKPAPLIEDLPTPGTDIAQLGHTRQEFWTCTRGQIMRYYHENHHHGNTINRIRAMDISNKISAGSSGSGIFSPCGELVGLYAFRTWYYQDSESTITLPKQEDGSTEYTDKVVIYHRHGCLPATEIRNLIQGKGAKK